MAAIAFCDNNTPMAVIVYRDINNAMAAIVVWENNCFGE